jgi:hypothetical protein
MEGALLPGGPLAPELSEALGPEPLVNNSRTVNDDGVFQT